MSFTLPTTGPAQQAVDTTHRLPRQQGRTDVSQALDALAADLDGTLAPARRPDLGRGPRRLAPRRRPAPDRRRRRRDRARRRLRRERRP